MALISLDDCCVRLASERTSSATTAKPRPCSPARAASMAALRASRLVCSAMAVMTCRIFSMSPLSADSWLTVSVAVSSTWARLWIDDAVSPTMRVPVSTCSSALFAAAAAWAAKLATSFTVAAIWLIAVATCSASAD